MLAFATYTMPDYQIGDHLRILAAKLEAVERGELKRLMVFMPPRHGKSEIVSKRFPAWCLGRRPKLQIISASYGAELAGDFGRDVRNIILSQEFNALFPKVTLAPDSTAKDRWHTNSGGGYVAAGVGTAVTGRGADVLNLDDPVKDRNEADSQPQRDRTWAWFTSTAYTRLMPGGSVILTMTRWHEDDLAGRILAQMKAGGEHWEVLSLPAIDTEGAALWPERYTLVDLNRTKRTIGERDWSALYQQTPTNQEGAIIRRDYWQPWLDPVPTKPALILISLDTAYTKDTANDASACTIWHLVDADPVAQLQHRKDASGNWLDTSVYTHAVDMRSRILLRYAWQKRLEFPELVDELAATVKHFGLKGVPMRVLVEAKASGLSVVQEMRRRMPNLNLHQIDPKGADKIARAHSITAMMEVGRVYTVAKLVDGEPEYRPWAEAVISECAAFPLGAHDDLVDSTTQALRHFRDLGVELFAEDEPVAAPLRVAGGLY